MKIGLEIHTYLNMEKSKAKLFCNCPAENIESTPNTNICPICTGMPGSKPMLPNREALEKVIAIASMLKCKINKSLIIQRKHYSWPDLPNGYQKTMSGPSVLPVGINGELKGIKIWGVHLEEDPAKWDPETGRVNYNRSGLPLAEIVTAPDLKSAEEAKEWLRSLVVLLSYIKATSRNVSIKADVNINVEGHPRVEVKNINSFKNICLAIDYEVKRQNNSVKNKEELIQETRGFDEDKNITFHMRYKESAEDYRFIPEPDLPIIFLKDKTIKDIQDKLPKTPEEKIAKYKQKYKLTNVQSTTLASELILADIFDEVIKKVNPSLAANWITMDLLKLFKEQEPEQFDIDVREFTKILELLDKKKITDKVTKDMVRKLLWKKISVKDYQKKFGIEKVSDAKVLEPLCIDVIKANPKAVEDYKKGKKEAFNSLMGQVMEKTKGKASYEEVIKIINKLLKK
ncbi:MAG TPA: Asp-tRNA(Asn)/Glu-tRNA(Gln) amidotransferase subunit GatB [Candidatus Nanoarchaeia archaeon]|nr:Asp-tRNA(Asn)/Glu-tRNA(Gln) amidotransferase subunit GatB [Candidatus Nanoarchaeia archaeon]